MFGVLKQGIGCSSFVDAVGVHGDEEHEEADLFGVEGARIFWDDEDMIATSDMMMIQYRMMMMMMRRVVPTISRGFNKKEDFREEINDKENCKPLGDATEIFSMFV